MDRLAGDVPGSRGSEEVRRLGDVRDRAGTLVGDLSAHERDSLIELLDKLTNAVRRRVANDQT